jgi:hypothetical protein
VSGLHPASSLRTLDGLDEMYKHPTTPAKRGLATVHTLSTITTPSSGSSHSNRASNRSTGSRDSCDKIPPQDIIDTLNFLERVEQEVSHEVARIKDNIKEARAIVDAYRREKRARVKENATLVAEEERQTRKADDEFWLAV